MPDDPVGSFSDEPIKVAEDDRLGRSLFVQRLATVLNNWTGETSLVIGLHAPWGEGKTSLINLLAPLLETNGFRVLRFSPWEWASRADLNDAFFDEIAVQLGHSSRKGTIEIAKAWRRYAARLKGTAKAVSLALPLLKATLIFCAVLSAFGLVWQSRTVVIAIFLVLCFAGAAAWAAKMFPAIADVIAPNDKDSEASLEQVRENLKHELTGWEGRVLVVVDDVDRLDPQQTADVLRLVKANGDLPRISYLLVGDRQVIADHVGKNLSVDGSAYLEKIIQLSFDLPSIDQRTLNAVFFEGLNSVLDVPGVSKDFDAARWATVFWTCVAPSIGSLRNVKRLLATLQFHFDMLNGAAAFEVNPIDLVALETMRIFEPKLYRAVKRSRTVLLEGFDDGDSGNQLAEDALDALLENSTEAHRQEWISSIKNLFPRLNRRKGAGRVDAGTIRSWERERRVCSNAFFERYFSFGVRDGELSESNFQLFLGADTRETYRDMLFAFEKQEILSVVIDRLRGCVKDVQQDRIEPLVTALFDSSESFSSRHSQMFGISPLTTAEFTVDELLKTLDPNDVEGVLDRSFAGTSGLKLPLEFVRRLWALEKDNQLQYPIGSATITRWQADMVARIANASATGNLMGKDGTLLYLHLWAEWGNLADASKAVSDALNTRQSTIELLKGLVVVAHSSNLNKMGGTERPYIRHSDISKYVDPELVYGSLKIRDDADARLLRLIHPEFGYFEKSLKRFRLGTSDDAIDIGEDDD